MRSWNFFELFPPPHYLEMPWAGINISDHAIRYVEFGRHGRNLTLKKIGEERISEGLVEDGYIKNAEALKAVLKNLADKHKFNFIKAALPEEKAFLFKTTAPKEAKSDLRSYLEFHIEENVPLPARDIIFDYSVIPGDIHSKHLDLSVAAFPRKVIEVYLDIFKSVGMEPISFEILGQAIAHALIPPNDESTYMIVRMGLSTTSIVIVSGGVVQFSSNAAIGGKHATAALAKYLGVELKEARSIQDTLSILPEKKNMEIFMAISGVVSSIKDEITRTNIYWQTHFNDVPASKKKINRILLVGRNVAIPGFEEYLSGALSIPAELANPWINAFSFDDFIPSIKFVDSLDFSAAIGLALPYDHV